MTPFKLPKRLADERDRFVDKMKNSNTYYGYDQGVDEGLENGFKLGFNACAELLFREVIGPMREALEFYSEKAFMLKQIGKTGLSSYAAWENDKGIAARKTLDRTKEWCE